MEGLLPTSVKVDFTPSKPRPAALARTGADFRLQTKPESLTNRSLERVPRNGFATGAVPSPAARKEITRPQNFSRRSNGEIALSAMFRYQSGDDNPRQRAEQSQFGQQQYRCKDHIWVTTHPIARFPLWPAVINVHDPEHIFRAEDHRSDHQYAGQQIPADKRMRDDKRDE